MSKRVMVLAIYGCDKFLDAFDGGYDGMCAGSGRQEGPMQHFTVPREEATPGFTRGSTSQDQAWRF